MRNGCVAKVVPCIIHTVLQVELERMNFNHRLDSRNIIISSLCASPESGCRQQGGETPSFAHIFFHLESGRSQVLYMASSPRTR
jgi:hypothetical protein